MSGFKRLRGKIPDKCSSSCEHKTTDEGFDTNTSCAENCIEEQGPAKKVSMYNRWAKADCWGWNDNPDNCVCLRHRRTRNVTKERQVSAKDVKLEVAPEGGLAE